jgi:dCMP deaminase
MFGGMQERPPRASWDAYFMSKAVIAATRSTCASRMVGAVLIQDKQERGTGFNGAPADLDDCLDVGCDDANTDGQCLRAIHAELNLILQTDRDHRKGATVYCTDQPCLRCATVLANSGIARVVYSRRFHRHTVQVEELFAAKGIRLDQFPLPVAETGALLPPAEVLATLGVSLVVHEQVAASSELIYECPCEYTRVRGEEAAECPHCGHQTRGVYEHSRTEIRNSDSTRSTSE